jgi:t-SNARE complex subunit (syntaxin)
MHKQGISYEESNDQMRKLSTEDNVALDEIMQEASSKVMRKMEDYTTHDDQSLQTRSKVERQLLKKLKKL